jgi:hypothetical protein
MRSTYFSDILHASLQLCGLDRNLTTPDRFQMVRDFASMRLRSVWEMNEWTDLKRYEKCLTTDVNERRKITLPVTNDQVIAVWNRDPVAVNAIQKDFDIVGDEVFLLNDTDSEVWVEFRLDAPRLYGNAYDAAQSYSKGAQVYYDEGSSSGSLVPVAGYAVQGDFYEWTSQNPSGVGTIPPLTWSRIRIPKLFANPIIHGVHADYRRSTGEIEPMQAAEADFAKAVDAALDQTLRQQGSTRKINFRTY